MPTILYGLFLLLINVAILIIGGVTSWSVIAAALSICLLGVGIYEVIKRRKK